MLGKLRQLSEQSQTELFDFISNNVVGIIKSEEVDDRMKEGGIEHKENVIQVQFDGLIDLIHTCNMRNILVKNKFVDGYMITNGQCIFQIGIHTLFFSSKK